MASHADLRQLMARTPLSEPRRRASDSSAARAGLIASSLGLVSATLIGWATGLWAIGLLYGGVLLSAIAASMAIGLFRRGRRLAHQDVDRDSLRGAINASNEPLAITSGEGALICANLAYRAALGGYPALADLAPDPVAQMGRIRKAIAQAQDGRTVKLDIDGMSPQERLSFSVSLLEGDSGLMLWRMVPRDQKLSGLTSLFKSGLAEPLAALDAALALATPEGRLLHANAAACDLLGLREPPASDAQIAGLMAASTVPLSVAEANVLDEDGAILALLLKLARRVDTLPDAPPGTLLPPYADALPLPLALADREGRLLYANAAFRSLTGVSLEHGVVYPSDMVAHEDRAAVSDLVRRVGAGAAQSQQMVVRLRDKSGEPVKLTAAQASGGAPAASVLTLTDNAEQQRLEQHLAQAQKMQAVGQLAGGIAHDFNNILQAILGYCELLLQRHLPGDASFADINQILSNANRAAGLVRQLLAYSRQQSLRPSVERVTDLITDQATTLRQLVREKAELVVHHARDAGHIRVDTNQFYQVMMNLVVNARDAIATRGTITVTTRMATPADAPERERAIMPQGDYVAIAVSDTGSGISPENISKIFDPFFTTKEVGKGTGLGLSTVYGIIKQSSGFIFADSAPGKGTTFTLFLPACEAPMASEKDATTQGPADLWGKGKLLLVEDEDAVRAFAVKALERKGYTVLGAASGEEALQQLEAEDDIELMISDVVMPGMDGPALVRAARARWPQLKVIMMSGYAEEQLRKSLEAPDIGFLPKPFGLNDLALAVKAAMPQG